MGAFFGDGTGAFTPVEVPFASATGSTGTPAFALADFDNSGTLDIAVVVTGLGITIVPNNGDRSFNLATTFGPVKPIVVSDFDGDGNSDIATINGRTLEVYGGTGSIASFISVVPVTSSLRADGNNVIALELADMNGDGKQDIVTSDIVGEIQILLNADELHFVADSAVALVNSATGPRIALGDLNNDGRPDIATGYSSAISGNPGGGYFLNLANQTLNGDSCVQLEQQPLSAVATPFASSLPDNVSSSTLADFNEDGNLDLALSRSSGGSRIYWGDGSGAFPTFTSVGPTINVRGVAALDFDQDNHQDVVLVLNSGQSALYFGDGSGAFPVTTTVGALTDTASAVVANDFTGDGKVDLVIASTANPATIRFYTGAGNRTAPLLAASFSIGAGLVNQLASADVNSDGNPDLIVARNVTGGVQVYLGTGTGFATTPLTIADALSTSAVSPGDFNNDGKIDLATVSNNKVNVFWGLGDGTFDASAVHMDFETVTALSTGDFDADGNLDIAASNATNAVLYYGMGDKSFLSRTSLPFSTASGTPKLSSGDLDNNGMIDLVRTGTTSGLATVALNQGRYAAGSVTSPLITPASQYPAAGGLQQWLSIIIDEELYEDTNITYDVLDANGIAIPGFVGLRPDENHRINISSLDAVAYPAIYLRANLSRDADKPWLTPELCSWVVTFRMAKGPAFTFNVTVITRSASVVPRQKLTPTTTVRRTASTF